MDHTYSDRKRTARRVSDGKASSPQPSLDALRSGTVKPTSEQMGRRVDLPDAMRSKMENAFGADLSAVKLYESRTVADAGAGAVTQGSSIAFAPGMLDFTSFGGQAMLGHEISHVVSQARGEVRGSGFLNDRSLEARADREGAMAAAGQQIAMPTQSLSSVTAAPAAGPMQAWGKDKNKKTYEPYMKIDPKAAGTVDPEGNIYQYAHNRDENNGVRVKPLHTREEANGLGDLLKARYSGPEYKKDLYGDITNGKDVTIRGLSLERMIPEMVQSLGDGYSNEEIIQLYDDLMATHRADVNPEDEASYGAANERFLGGLRKLKEMQYNKLKRMEATFGKLGSQMHPDDFIRAVGDQYNDYFHLTQDTQQMLTDAPKSVLDPEHNREDAEYKALHEYYAKVSDQTLNYALFSESNKGTGQPMTPDMLDPILVADPKRNPDSDPKLLSAVHGPSMSYFERKDYLKGLHRRADMPNSPISLFGKFAKKVKKAVRAPQGQGQ